jgi:hypothetical protein
MQDAESKLALLTYYAEEVARIACAIRDDYIAKVYGRSVFLAVEAFLAIAPRLKNEMLFDGRLTESSSSVLTSKIKKLRSDFEGYYAAIRDKLVAHQQEIDLGLLLQAWNEIDATTLTILSEDLRDIWICFQSHGASSSFVRPAELDDENSLSEVKRIVPTTSVRIGVDRVARTRPKTISIIPNGIFQEKTIRVLTAFEGYQALIRSGLEQMTANWALPHKACIDLFVTDACSIIDNLFEDRQASSQVVAEQSLVNMWGAMNILGIERLETFRRDWPLEQRLRELRNKFSAHLDPNISLTDLIEILNSFPLQDLDDYLKSIWLAFRDVCAQDIRTRPFLIHGEEVKGANDVDTTDAVKSFR